MKILIADDERPARTRLRQLLQRSDLDVEVVGEVDNGDQVLELCEVLMPDVVLLDIRMPGKTGMEICKQLSTLNQAPAVIIVTAYNQHALQAFDAHAVDYVLKPVDQQRLNAALHKAAIFRAAHQLVISQRLVMNNRRTHITVTDRDIVYRVPVSEINYFKAEQKYVVIRTDKLELLSTESLKNLEVEFAENLTRVHRNALVANQFIASLEKHSDSKYYVHFTHIDDVIEISRRHRTKVRHWLKMYGSQGVA